MKNGFTLIELLIVITILGILSTIGIGNFQTSRIKARDLNRKTDLSTIAKSLEAYVNDHKQYPTAAELVWDTPFIDENGTIYVAKLPSDPSSFTYAYNSDGTSYTLYAHLENTQDPSITTFTPEVVCGSALCNYKITSSNTL